MQRGEHTTRWAVTAPPTLFLLAFFLVPAFIVVLASFQYPGEFGGLAPLADPGDGREHGLTLENYQFFFSDFLFTEIFLRSLAVATAATLACLVLAYPVAWLIARSPKRHGEMLLAARNSLFIALVSSTAATALGTLAGLAIHRYRFRWLPLLVITPVAMPEILLGVSLLVFFIQVLHLTLGLLSVVLVIAASRMDKSFMRGAS